MPGSEVPGSHSNVHVSESHSKASEVYSEVFTAMPGLRKNWVHNNLNIHHDKGESLADVACRAQPRATTSRGFPLPPRLLEKRSRSRGGKAAGVLAMWTRARLIFGLHETSSVGGKRQEDRNDVSTPADLVIS